MSEERFSPTRNALMTIDEWGALEEDVSGELVDGRLEEEEMSSFVHELCVVWLIQLLGVWLLPRGGFVFGSDAKFAVRSRRGRKPDLSVFLPGTAKPPRTGVCRTPPDIMIEVITPTPRDQKRDRIDKLADYARFGVRYYWLLDPEAHTLEILELGADGRYVHALDASRGRHGAVPGCSGLTFDLDGLWLEIERLEAQDGG